MRQGEVEELRVDGLPWPTIAFAHQSMAVVSRLPAAASAVAIALGMHVADPAQGGPATPEAMAQWVEYHPALALPAVIAVVRAHAPTMREQLMLRVLATHRPGDGVFELPGPAPGETPCAELGWSTDKPMAKPYATRWDIRGPSPAERQGYKDMYIEHLPGRGIGAYVHPALFGLVCPRLRGPVTYHAIARPGAAPLTWAEYQGMSAFEVACHRILRDTTARGGPR